MKKLKKTPLILDSSPNQIADTYFKFKNSTIVDGATLVDPEGMEAARKKLVIAMLAGHNFVIALGKATPDLASLCDPTGLPHETLIQGAVEAKEVTDRFVRPEDLTTNSSEGPADYLVGQSGVFFIRDTFRVVVTSSLKEADYRQRLGTNTLRLWDFHTLYIDPDFV